MSSLVPGQPVPAFTAHATRDRTVSPADLKGQPWVLYFYPKDHTPGCTTEAGDFRDLYPQFQALGCEVFGVSRDSLRTHENFRAKLELPFDLISDPEETLCRLFDVIRLKKLYGREYEGIDRSTFLVAADGTLLQAWRKVKVPGHAEAVLDALRAN